MSDFQRHELARQEMIYYNRIARGKKTAKVAYASGLFIVLGVALLIFGDIQQSTTVVAAAWLCIVLSWTCSTIVFVRVWEIAREERHMRPRL